MEERGSHPEVYGAWRPVDGPRRKRENPKGSGWGHRGPDRRRKFLSGKPENVAVDFLAPFGAQGLARNVQMTEKLSPVEMAKYTFDEYAAMGAPELPAHIVSKIQVELARWQNSCLLYTSDAADE